MKVLILLVLIAYTFCYLPLKGEKELPINDDSIINQLNSIPKKWVAGKNDVFNGLKYWDVVPRFLGARPRATTYPKKTYQKVQHPEAFDWRDQTPMCAHAIRDQANCGSCYAFGASEAVSDRFCIASKGKIDVVMSPQWIVSCDKQELGCSGGYPNRVWDFMSKTGIVSDKCFPYTSSGGSVEACPTKCKDGSALQYYKVKNVTTVSGAVDMMTELLVGPFEVCFAVYRDFFNYKSGVYHHTSGSLAGYHAVKIIGWGVDQSKTPYWIVANSWGTGWGNKGFFWILKGKDECQMESGVGGQLPNVAGDPVL